MFKWLEGWFTPSEKKVKVPEEAMGLKPIVRKPVVKKPKAKILSKEQMSKLTKVQLEQMGRENGIELDRRKTKEKLIEQLHKKLTKKVK